jgi:hypothetical protein
MKLILVKLLYLLLAFPYVFAQSTGFISSIGNFNNATAFDISANGIIYVTESGNDQIISLDTLGNILKTAGGFGWSEAAFDNPVDVFATPLSVYIADKNNHRIQRFDRDLNFVSTLSTRQRENIEARFGYPSGIVLSNQGDWYILDSENHRIVKFDLFGNYVQHFGGFDAGNYQLKKPLSLAISPDNHIYVSDETGIVVFDSFGNGVGRLEISEEIVSVRIMFDDLIINSKENIYHRNLRSYDMSLQEIDLSGYKLSEMISALKFSGRLYVLTSKEIIIFNLTL